MVKITTEKSCLVEVVTRDAIYKLVCVMLIFSSVVNGQQQNLNEQQPPQPLASNNNPMQQPLQGQINNNPFANCSLATVKPTASTKTYIFGSCIVAQFSAYLSVGPNKFVELNNGVVNVNNSQCDKATEKEPKLNIDFPCASLTFEISHTNDSTFINSIEGMYYFSEGNKVNNVTFLNTTARFSTSHTGHYYKCNSEQAVPLESGGNLTFSNFALEAYRGDTKGTEFFKIPEECSLDSQPVSDLVRIGVGVCLVALVAIVLIAYFVGRRRWAERSSYESV